MPKTTPNPKVDVYINKAKLWQDETEQLRNILLNCGLSEDLKWGKPCYSFANSNIAVIQGFKQYFALLFFKGVLLQDPKGILVKTGENTHVGRQMRFENVSEITKLKPAIKAFIQQAIDLEKAGAKVEPKKTSELSMPDEFQTALKKNTSLKIAFKALTPGRQKGYIFYFSQPKQSATRQSRIEKCIPQILSGKGLND